MVLTRGEGVKRIFDFSLRQDESPSFLRRPRQVVDACSYLIIIMTH